MAPKNVAFFGFLICSCLSTFAYAAVTPVTPGDEIDKLYTVNETLAPLGTNPVGGHIDLESGQLTIREVDVSIPGNSDLPVEFARTFAPDGHFYNAANSGILVPTDRNDLGELRDWRIDVPKIYAVLAESEEWPNDRCSRFGAPPSVHGFKGDGPYFEPSSYWQGYHVHLPGKGTQELLDRENNNLSPGDPSDFPIVTNNLWMVQCRNIGGMDANGDTVSTSGEGFTLHTQDGWTYYFDHLVVKPHSALTNGEDTLFRNRYIMFASRVEDALGNWVKYDYNTAGRLTTILANDGREIHIAYYGSGADAGKVQSVTANGNTWTYIYSSDDYHRHLHKVQLPDGRSWTFNLNPLADYAMSIQYAMRCEGPGLPQGYQNGTGSIVSPWLAEVTFVVAPTKRSRGDVSESCYWDGEHLTKRPKEYYTFAIQRRTIEGPNMGILTWNYNYSNLKGWYWDESGAAQKWTAVLDPDGGKTVYFFDMRADWREGNLNQIDYYFKSAGSTSYQLVRQVWNYYDPREDMDAGWSDQGWANGARAKTIVRQIGQKIAQDGATYNWEIPDPIKDFDVYNNPLVLHKYNSTGQQLTKRFTYENRINDWWLGQLKSVEVLAPDDVYGKKPYEATYLSNGRIGSVTRFGRPIGTYEWNSAGQLTKITDPLGYHTDLTNYYRGRPQNIRFPDGGEMTLDVDGDGTLASIRNTRGYLTSYDYDELGRLEKITYPTNNEIPWDSTTFDLTVADSLAVGSVRRIRTTGALAEATYYDALLRPVLTRRGPPGEGVSYVRREFDSAGHLVFESYPATSRTASDGIHYVYDGLGRLTSVKRDTENGQAVEAISYYRNQRTVVDARGNATIYTYRNLAAPDYKLLMRIDAPEDQTTVIERDGLGAMISATRSGSSGGYTVSPQTRQYIYNATRDLCMVVDPETGVTVMHYDARGLMDWQALGISSSSRDCAAVSVPSSEKTVFNYDGKRRLLHIDYPGTVDDITKGYDTEDNITSVITGPETDPITKWTYTYNGRNLLKYSSLSLDSRTFILDPSYNSRAQLTSVAYPGSTRTVAFNPDAYGRPMSVGGVVSDVNYYPNDAVKSYTYDNGTTMSMTQNTRGLPAKLSYPGINIWGYGYDLNGNLMSVDFQGPDGAPNEDRTNFGYDGLNRLLKVDGPWGASRFTYDALDNLRTKQYGGLTQSYIYNADNRLVSISGDRTYTLGYDAQGNITQRNGDTFTFDQANRMTSATGGGSYVYDGWGRRVKTTAPDGELTYTIYSRAGQLVQEYKPSVEKRTDYLYLAGKLVAAIANSPASPAAAGSLSVSNNPLDGSYRLSWPEISGAVSYWLTEKGTDGKWNDVYKGSGLYADIAGKIGGDYDYRLAGCTNDGCGKASEITVGVAPTKPTLSVPSSTQNGSYTISWSAPKTATYYDLIEYKNGGWTTAAYHTLSTSKSREQIGGSYQYRVRAYNEHGTRGYTDYSAVVKVLPPAPEKLTTNDTTAVDSRFTIDWSASAGATTYRLRRRQQRSDGSWSGWTYGVKNVTYRTYGYHDLPDGTYQFQVQAYTDGVGYGSWKWGPTVKVEWTPPAPTLSAPSYVPSMDLYTVSWSRPSGVTHFYLQRRHMVNTTWSDWVTYSTTGTSKQFLESSGTFNVRVKGCKSFVCSGYSAIKTTTVGSGGCYTSGGETQAVKPEDTDQLQTDTQAMPPPC